MLFDLTEEQCTIQDAARAFAQNEMLPKAAAWDEEKTFPAEVLREAAALDLGGL